MISKPSRNWLAAATWLQLPRRVLSSALGCRGDCLRTARSDLGSGDRRRCGRRRRRTQSNFRSRGGRGSPGRRTYCQRQLSRAPRKIQSGREVLNALQLRARDGLAGAVQKAIHQILVENLDVIPISGFDSVRFAICLGHALAPWLAIRCWVFGFCCQAGFSSPFSRVLTPPNPV